MVLDRHPRSRRHPAPRPRPRRAVRRWPPRAGCGCATRASSPSATSRSPGSPRPTASGCAPRCESAAQEMTTLHVREQALREATAILHVGRSDLRVRDRLPARDDDRGDRAPSRSRRSREGAASAGSRSRGDGDPAARRDRRARSSEPRAAPDRGRPEAHRPARAARADDRQRGARSRCWPARRPARDRVNAGLSSRSKNGPELVFGSDEDAQREVASRRRACWPRPRPRARPISTSGFPGGWPLEGSLRSTPEDENPNPQPEAENSPTLNRG